MTFFIGKGKWLEKRFHAVKKEMVNRGMQVDLIKNEVPFAECIKHNFYNDWWPKEVDIQ